MIYNINNDPFIKNSLKYFNITFQELNENTLHMLYNKYIENTNNEYKYNVNYNNEKQLYNYYNIINYLTIEHYIYYQKYYNDNTKLNEINNKIINKYTKLFKKKIK
jgi:hypothetical protein